MPYPTPVNDQSFAEFLHHEILTVLKDHHADGYFPNIPLEIVDKMYGLSAHCKLRHNGIFSIGFSFPKFSKKLECIKHVDESEVEEFYQLVIEHLTTDRKVEKFVATKLIDKITKCCKPGEKDDR